jgi:hypothetical protein|tara:strand:- start:2208 stop:2351 length:144 start_codon:yes stop_codon:yes gene_type:complete
MVPAHGGAGIGPNHEAHKVFNPQALAMATEPGGVEDGISLEFAFLHS